MIKHLDSFDFTSYISFENTFDTIMCCDIVVCQTSRKIKLKN